jgi:hypothetical protein
MYIEVQTPKKFKNFSPENHIKITTGEINDNGLRTRT